MNIIITGGGTGGHLSVAKNIKNIIKQNNDIYYVGSKNGFDQKWFAKDKDFKKVLFLNTRGVVNKRFFGKLISLFFILCSSIKCVIFMLEHKIDQVICVGGYSSAPASFGAILTKTPLIVHEQNFIMGSLNKILSKYAKHTIYPYSKQYEYIYPVHKDILANQRIRKSTKTILFLGGSQGATFINNLAMSIAKDLNRRNINIIHQCGKNNIQKISQFYKSNNIKVEFFDFSNNMADILKKSDFAISRSGASSMWELILSAIPCIFIPYPYAANNHQYHNAKYFANKQLAYLICQKNISDMNIVVDIITNKNNASLSKNLIKFSSNYNEDKISQVLSPQYLT